MSRGGRTHQHMCPTCRQTELCAESQCYRTNYAERRLCGRSVCRQERATLQKIKDDEREAAKAPQWVNGRLL